MMQKVSHSIEEVPYYNSRSSVKFQGHPRQKNADFDTNWSFTHCNSNLTPMTLKWCTGLGVVKKRCPIVFEGHPWNFKVTQDNKSPILTWIVRFKTVTPVWINRYIYNVAQILKQCRRGALLQSNFEVTRAENRLFDSNLSKIVRPVAAVKSLRFALLMVELETISYWYWGKISENIICQRIRCRGKKKHYSKRENESNKNWVLLFCDISRFMQIHM